jgi:hypothetical protein
LVGQVLDFCFLLEAHASSLYLDVAPAVVFVLAVVGATKQRLFQRALRATHLFESLALEPPDIACYLSYVL